MANYAVFCPKCRTFSANYWGNYKCSRCGYMPIKQSRVEELTFNSYPIEKQIECFNLTEDEIKAVTFNMSDAHQEELKAIEESHKKEIEGKKLELRKFKEQSSSLIVTTGDLKCDYEILGPVFFQLNDAGGGTTFRNYLNEYKQMLADKANQRSNDQVSTLEMLGAVANVLSIFAGGPQDRDLLGNNHTQFDAAFFIGVEELKYRAALLGGDAIIGMRQDFDLDTNGFQHFYLQLYGTAVKRIL